MPSPVRLFDVFFYGYVPGYLPGYVSVPALRHSLNKIPHLKLTVDICSTYIFVNPSTRKAPYLTHCTKPYSSFVRTSMVVIKREQECNPANDTMACILK